MRGLIKLENTGHSTAARGLRISLEFLDLGTFISILCLQMRVRNKEIKDYINVSVVVDIDWGDTR